MFRKMRRHAQQLTEEQCLKILREEPRGVLAVHGDDDYPYTVPLDFYFDEENGKIYFHCAKVGHKIDALLKDNKVSFCVMDKGYHKPGHWEWNVRSVVAFGRIRFVQDEALKKRELYGLGRKYFPTEEMVQAEYDHSHERAQVLELNIEHMTGKEINEK